MNYSILDWVVELSGISWNRLILFFITQNLQKILSDSQSVDGGWCSTNCRKLSSLWFH